MLLLFLCLKSLGQDLTCAVFSDQNYENENENQ